MALTGAPVASAVGGAPRSPAPPSAPTAADTQLLALALGLEATASRLYALAAEAQTDETAVELAVYFGNNHAFYSEQIAGIAGLSANYSAEQIFDELSSSFDTSDVATFAEAAADLEATASVTHSTLVGEFDSQSARTLSASISIIEARMSTVMIALSGRGDDLDAMLLSDAEPLELDAAATATTDAEEG
jgi:hypothetical protein